MLNVSALDEVTVNLPSGVAARSQVRAHVLAVGMRTIALEANEKADVLRLKEHFSYPGCYLTTADTDASLFAFKGTLVLAEPVGDLRFVVDDHVADPDQATKILAAFPVRITRSPPGEPIEGETISISPYVILVTTDEDFDVGDRVQLELDLAELDLTLRPQATVLRSGGGAVAFGITEDFTKERATLAHLVISSYRAKLSGRRHHNARSLPEF